MLGDNGGINAEAIRKKAGAMALVRSGVTIKVTVTPDIQIKEVNTA